MKSILRTLYAVVAATLALLGFLTIAKLAAMRNGQDARVAWVQGVSAEEFAGVHPANHR